MKVIYKYELTPYGTATMLPVGSTILSVKEQHGTIVMYALIDQSQGQWESIEYVIYGTGHTVYHDTTIFILILLAILALGVLGIMQVNQSNEMSKWESFTLHEREAEMMYYRRWDKYHREEPKP